jgi:hypothetical protein
MTDHIVPKRRLRPFKQFLPERKAFGQKIDRFSPVLMDTIKTECKCRRIDFSNYIRFAAKAAMKHTKKSGSAEASGLSIRWPSVTP